jgi:hypothetical protein
MYRVIWRRDLLKYEIALPSPRWRTNRSKYDTDLSIRWMNSLHSQPLTNIDLYGNKLPIVNTLRLFVADLSIFREPL